MYCTVNDTSADLESHFPLAALAQFMQEVVSFTPCPINNHRAEWGGVFVCVGGGEDLGVGG